MGNNSAIPVVILEPLAGRVRVLLWLVFALQLPVLAIVAWIGPPVARLLCGLYGALFIVGLTVAFAWYRRRKMEIWLRGTDVSARVIDRRTAWRGGFPLLTVEYTIGGRRVTADGAVDMQIALNRRPGDHMLIRVNPDHPRSWVPVPQNLPESAVIRPTSDCPAEGHKCIPS